MIQHLLNARRFQMKLTRSRIFQVTQVKPQLFVTGGVCDDQNFHGVFPPSISEQNLDISSLELSAIVIAWKLWGGRWTGLCITVRCDNEEALTVVRFVILLPLLQILIFLTWIVRAITEVLKKAIKCLGPLTFFSSVLAYCLHRSSRFLAN